MLSHFVLMRSVGQSVNEGPRSRRSASSRSNSRSVNAVPLCNIYNAPLNAIRLSLSQLGHNTKCRSACLMGAKAVQLIALVAPPCARAPMLPMTIAVRLFINNSVFVALVM